MPADLKKSTLGRTGLEVARLGYGAMELRGQPRGRSVSDEQAGDILNSVLDAGINFIDTSIDYGRSEELIGEHISHRRSEYYLASKCGCPVGGLPSGAHVFTRDNIIAGVNQSLLRMRTDYLDLVQLHASPSKETLESEEVVQTLLDLKKEGKVRLFGSSSTLPHLADLAAMAHSTVFRFPTRRWTVNTRSGSPASPAVVLVQSSEVESLKVRSAGRPAAAMCGPISTKPASTTFVRKASPVRPSCSGSHSPIQTFTRPLWAPSTQTI